MTAGLLVLILLLSLGLRFYRLGAQSLWNDEGTSVAVAQRDLSTIARDAANDIHPPLYYWFLSGWIRLFGSDEVAVRSLSALLGVVLVWLTYAIGRSVAGRGVGLLAALLAAIHPFQIAYSQETRMYMLSAVLTAASVLAVLSLTKQGTWRTWLALAILESAGLYTHYSFVFVIVVLNLWFGLELIVRSRGTLGQPETPSLRGLGVQWLLSQAGAVLLYTPWLPTAVRQVVSWPRLQEVTPLTTALTTTWAWLVYGPSLPDTGVFIPLATALIATVAGLLYLVTTWSAHRSTGSPRLAGLLLLWLGLPVLLMVGLHLYREAYLKFLLITTPALVTLLACSMLTPGLATPGHANHGAPDGPTARRARGRRADDAGDGRPGVWKSPGQQAPGLANSALRLVQLAAFLIILAASGISLHNYYTDPAYARDNYRGIADYLGAAGRPGDAIVLNAPGQQEVFDYYYTGTLPVYPLPLDRPANQARTQSALAELSRPGGRVFAILWATTESDPGRVVEGWLDSHAYKALDSWYGNVRLAVYAVPERSPSTPDHMLSVSLNSSQTGDRITLLGYSLLKGDLAAGDIAQISLFWTVDQTPTRRYKVFLHVLDEGNHIVGQRDAEPGGGAALTTLWAPGMLIIDNYGVPIHPATPPGLYRVEVGAYEAETGQRLLAPDGSAQIWIGPLDVARPETAIPEAMLDMQYTLNRALGELTLLGYDAHVLGFAHQPDRAPRPGDIAEIALYWQARQRPTGTWKLQVQLAGADGRVWSEIRAEPVTGYPTDKWDAGDIWRGLHHLPIPLDTPPGRYRLQIQALAPDGSEATIDLPKLMRVGP